MWIKICGICDPDTAVAVCQQRPQAIGLNFYPESPRCVPPDVAREIVERLPSDIEAVGLFVNMAPEEISIRCRTCGVHTAQLHGDETPECLEHLQRLSPELHLIRAFRIGHDGLEEVADWISESRARRIPLRACLIDARTDGAFGGTGKTAPWELISQEYRRDDWPPLLLAGGLNPDNVQTAIRTVQPWGVDVASGVESSPGTKDPILVRRFMRAASRSESGPEH